MPKTNIKSPLLSPQFSQTHKSVPIEDVPNWVQERFLHFQSTGQAKHPLDIRAFVFWGLLPKSRKSRSHLSVEEKKAHKRQYDRDFYRTRIKPLREKVKHLEDTLSKTPVSTGPV